MNWYQGRIKKEETTYYKSTKRMSWRRFRKKKMKKNTENQKRFQNTGQSISETSVLLQFIFIFSVV